LTKGARLRSGSLAVAWCLSACSFKGPPAAVVHAPATKAVIIDDQTIGRKVDHFAYVGKWEHVRGRRDGRYNGTSSRSYRPGDSASIFFFGRRFGLHGVVGPGGGPATLAIDSQLHTISFFSRVKRASTVYLSAAMPEGPHSVVVVVGVKPKDIAPTGFVNIDYARIDP
jgi:hypothetical protein